MDEEVKRILKKNFIILNLKEMIIFLLVTLLLFYIFIINSSEHSFFGIFIICGFLFCYFYYIYTLIKEYNIINKNDYSFKKVVIVDSKEAVYDEDDSSDDKVGKIEIPIDSTVYAEKYQVKDESGKSLGSFFNYRKNKSIKINSEAYLIKMKIDGIERKFLVN